jgi:endonuclease/exonuclease/phosphatase family metal-dependent hydrolase
MYRPILSAMIFFFLIAVLLSCGPQPERELRVLTFNIHHGETIEGEMDLEAMAAVIRSARPDLVALQEVDVHTSRVGGISVVQELAELCKMDSYFAKAMDYVGGEYGNAILSSHPILEGAAFKLPSSAGHEPRVAASGLIALPADTLLFISTHFDHSSGNPDRPAQAKAILDEFRGKSRPSLLAGDLNDTPESETLKILQQHWSISGAPTDYTIPVKSPSKKIDYILYAPQDGWKVVRSEVLPDAVSDHLAVLTVFERMGLRP